MLGLSPSSQISNFSDLEVQSNPTHSTHISNSLVSHQMTTATLLMAHLPSPNRKLTPHKPNDLQTFSPSSSLSPNSATQDHKRKDHPDSPVFVSKKPRPASPTAETIYFDPKTVTIIPKYQLHGYHLEKKAKTDAKRFQFGGFHLPVEDFVDVGAGGSATPITSAVVIEEGSN